MSPKKKAKKVEEAEAPKATGEPVVESVAEEAAAEEVAAEPEEGAEAAQELEEEAGGAADEAIEPEDGAAEEEKAPAEADDTAELDEIEEGEGDFKEDEPAEGEEDIGEDEEDEEDAPAPKAKPKGKEKPKELEVDAEPDERERVSAVALSEYDSTLDVFFSSGNIVSSLSQGGFQHLLSGVRATAGAKGGRYFFEVKVLEKKNTETDSTLRLGVSVAKTSLFLGDGTADHVGFDMDGTYLCPTLEDASKRQSKVFTRKIQFQVIGILLNLDSGSPNANTLSVFCDGARLSEPMQLPAHLVGKALYPTITFKNYTLAVNLGGDGLVMKKLPFRCPMFGNAALADTESSSFASPPAGSKCSVIVPIGLPDEGYFDYVDRFIQSHPDYVELSDRKMLEWCLKSGLSSWKSNMPASRDRPAFNFGIPSIDNRGIRQSLRGLTQIVKRNYVVAELKGNFVGKDREEMLARFAAPHFDVTAQILIGEPTTEHKDWVHGIIKANFEKKKAETIAAAKRAEERKQLAEERKKLAAERVAERAKAKAGKDKPDKKAEEEKEGIDEPPEKKQKVEEKDEVKDEVKEEEVKQEEKEEEAGPDVGPSVWWIPRGKNPEDMGKKAVGQSLSSFSLPSDTEGFDKVEYIWSAKAAAEEYLQKWVVEKKATLIVEGLKPGEWFIEKQKAWEAVLKEMKGGKKPAKGATIAVGLRVRNVKNNRKGKVSEVEEGGDKFKVKFDDGDEHWRPIMNFEAEDGRSLTYAAASEEKPAKKDKKDGEEGGEEDAKEKEAVDPLHAGGEDGKPLYAEFEQEDWVLLSWRHDLHLLAHAFATDSGDAKEDAEVHGIPVDHVGHYFDVYFKRRFNTRSLGCAGLPQVVDLCEEVLKIETKGKMQFLKPIMNKEAEPIEFVKQVEECRQDRVRRIEAGDESARLNIPSKQEDGGRHDRKSSKGKGKGGKSKKDEHRKGASSYQEKRGFRQSFSFRVRTAVRQEARAKGHSKKGGRDVHRNRPAARPWDRTHTAGHWELRSSSGKGGGYQKREAWRPQENRSTAVFDRKRPATQLEPRRSDLGRVKGGGKSSHSGPDAKRPRYNSSTPSAPPAPARAAPPAPPRAPIRSGPSAGTHRPLSGGRGAPSRGSMPAALPQSSRPMRPSERDGARPVHGSVSKGDPRGSERRSSQGHSRDVGASSRDSYRDGGHRPSSTPSKSDHAQGGHKGNDRRPSSSDGRYPQPSSSKGSSKGADRHGGRDDRRDTRSRGYPSSSDRHRSGGERDHRDHGRRNW